MHTGTCTHAHSVLNLVYLKRVNRQFFSSLALKKKSLFITSLSFIWASADTRIMLLSSLLWGSQLTVWMCYRGKLQSNNQTCKLRPRGHLRPVKLFNAAPRRCKSQSVNKLLYPVILELFQNKCFQMKVELEAKCLQGHENKSKSPDLTFFFFFLPQDDLDEWESSTLLLLAGSKS